MKLWSTFFLEVVAKTVIYSVHRHVALTKHIAVQLFEVEQELEKMGRFKTKSDYEQLRNARIVENQARLSTLGLQKTLSELRSLNSSPKPKKRKCCKVNYSAAAAPLRRSARLAGKSPPSEGVKLSLSYSEGENGDVKRGLRRSKFSKEALGLGRRCESRRREIVYDFIYGICCHFCRQKKLCREEDCKHCGDRDMDEPCIGKTACSVCHSANGIFCRACLLIRYGEEMEEVD